MSSSRSDPSSMRSVSFVASVKIFRPLICPLTDLHTYVRRPRNSTCHFKSVSSACACNSVRSGSDVILICEISLGCGTDVTSSQELQFIIFLIVLTPVEIAPTRAWLALDALENISLPFYCTTNGFLPWELMKAKLTMYALACLR